MCGSAGCGVRELVRVCGCRLVSDVTSLPGRSPEAPVTKELRHPCCAGVDPRLSIDPRIYRPQPRSYSVCVCSVVLARPPLTAHASFFSPARRDPNAGTAPARAVELRSKTRKARTPCLRSCTSQRPEMAIMSTKVAEPTKAYSPSGELIEHDSPIV
jgi:hypothetical protein